jgi:transposase
LLLLFSLILLKEATAMGKKVARSGRVGKEIGLLDGERAFVGVDVHKKSYSVCVWGEVQGPVCQWVQPANPAALARRLEPVGARVARVVYEAGPTGYALVRHLRACGFGADVIAPSRTPNQPGRRGKGDRRDAAELAFLAARDMLTPIYVPTPQEEADRQVVRRRNQLARDLRRAKHRIRSFLLQHSLGVLDSWSREAVDELRSLALGAELRLCLDSMLSDYDYLRGQLQAVERHVAELARGERHARGMRLLESVPGVGTITAMTFQTELPRPERFKMAEAVASFTGLAPCVRQSGQRTRSGPILKTGNRFLRCLLIEAAWRWKRYDPAARELFNHLLSRTASPNKAIVGVARHLAILLWVIVTAGAPYTPPPQQTERVGACAEA